MTLDLVTLESAGAVREEVRSLFCLVWPEGDPGFLDKGWDDVVRLYEGGWPGYHACDTPYHNFSHVMTVTLAMARLLHGSAEDGHRVSEGRGTLALIAALFHDAGLIRHATDLETRGAELTPRHVERGIAMLDVYLKDRGMGEEACRFTGALLSCTDLLIEPSTVNFTSDSDRYLGVLLKAADLSGQMADRCYGQKLLLLADELQDVEKGAFMGVWPLLQNTPDFCRRVLEQMEATSGQGVLSHYQTHFRMYRGVDRNVYIDQIRGQIHLLEGVVTGGEKAWRTSLEKGGVKMGCPTLDFDAIYPKQ